VIPYGKWHSVAVPWNTSINGYTVSWRFVTFYISALEILLLTYLLTSNAALFHASFWYRKLSNTAGQWNCAKDVSHLLFILLRYTKGRYSSSWGEPTSELQDVTWNMGSHSVVTCHPTQVNVPRLTPAMQAGGYWIYLPRRDKRLSWRSWLDSAPAKSWTSDLSITSPTSNYHTTKTATLDVRKHLRDPLIKR